MYYYNDCNYNMNYNKLISNILKDFYTSLLYILQVFFLFLSSETLMQGNYIYYVVFRV